MSGGRQINRAGWASIVCAGLFRAVDRGDISPDAAGAIVGYVVGEQVTTKTTRRTRARIEREWVRALQAAATEYARTQTRRRRDRAAAMND